MSMKNAAKKQRRLSLQQYFKETFKKECLPGDYSVPSGVFINELNKV